MRVDPRPDRGPADGELREGRARSADPADAMVDLRLVAGELAFTIGSNSFAFFARLSSSSRSAGRRFWSTSIKAATWMAVGMTSFEDCPMFTWSFG